MKNQTLVRVVALSIPLATILSVASAKPRDGVPAYGYRRGNGQGQGQGQREVVRDNAVRGIVSRVYSNREFDVQAQGRIVRVKTDAYQNLQPGDYVVARGDLRGGTFYAETINRRDDNVRGNQGRETRVNFQGEVVQVESPTSFRVRATDGRVFAVRTVGALGRRISRGDVVRVQGRFDGSFVRANNEDVDLLRNDNTYNGGYNNGGYNNGGYNNGGYNNGGYNNGARVSFRGRVTRLLGGNEIEVRSDNGQTFRVRVPQAIVGYSRVGDQVQVQGSSRSGIIVATNVDRLR